MSERRTIHLVPGQSMPLGMLGERGITRSQSYTIQEAAYRVWFESHVDA
jgi:hypothetical protein